MLKNLLIAFYQWLAQMWDANSWQESDKLEADLDAELAVNSSVEAFVEPSVAVIAPISTDFHREVTEISAEILTEALTEIAPIPEVTEISAIAEETETASVAVESPIEVVGCYAVTKAGNTPEECEDAYAWEHRESAFYFALSDGATESSFSREWAKELVQTCVQRSLWQQEAIPEEVHTAVINDWLLPLQQQWADWLKNQNLVWFAKRKAEQGTFATLLGLEIHANQQWQALAVGDSCLFVVRDGRLLHSFPLSSCDQLGYRPCLVGTLIQSELPNVVQQTGDTTQSGDHFYLVTDALASWIFTSLETNQNPWVQLNQIQTQAAFADWVEHLRTHQEIPNDDTTLLHITVQ